MNMNSTFNHERLILMILIIKIIERTDQPIPTPFDRLHFTVYKSCTSLQKKIFEMNSGNRFLSSSSQHYHHKLSYSPTKRKQLSLTGHQQHGSIEFFYNSLFSAKSWQNSASIDGEKQKKNCPQSGLNPQSLDHHSNALPTELGRKLLGMKISEVSFVGLLLFPESIEHDFIKAMKIQAGN